MSFRKKLALALIFVACNSHGSGNSGSGIISGTYQRSSDGLMWIQRKEGNWNNPNQCDNDERVVLERNNESRSEFYSAILASSMSKTPVSFYLSGCVLWNGVTYPRIVGMFTY